MGDISIIARRLEGGKYVQYGWSGNGGYFKAVGYRLLEYYNDPDKVEYLFGLGQLRLVGKPGSERGGESLMMTTHMTGEPHYLGKTEREIFSQIAFIDYGYFYDTDNVWYYVIPGPFRIKVPLEYIYNNVDDRGYEFDERNRIEEKLLRYILGDYCKENEEFASLIGVNYSQGAQTILEEVLGDEYSIHFFWEKYHVLFNYLDDWVIVKTDEKKEKITGFILHKNQEGEQERVETIDWK